MARNSERSWHRPNTVRSQTGRQVVILRAAGPLTDAVPDLDRATRYALSRGPRGVICDLSNVVAPGTPGALRALATIGRHPRDWPGVPVAVAGLAPRAGERLCRLPLGYHLVVSDSVAHALSWVLRAGCPAIKRQRLSPHPTAPRAARAFIHQTLSSWQIDDRIPAASLVASELVSNAVVHAGTDLELSLAAHRGCLRLAVADKSRNAPALRHGEARGMGLAVVAAHATAWGVLPADDGKVVWAVLGAS